MKKICLVICLTSLTCSFAIAQNISISYEIGFSDVAFSSSGGYNLSSDYNSKIGNALYLLGEWPTKNNSITLLTGLSFGEYQLEEKTAGLVFIEDVNAMNGSTRTASLEQEISFKFIGIPTLLRCKKDWKKLQGFITGGFIFRRLQFLSSKRAIVYTDGEIDPLESINEKAIFDFTFYTNIGCLKRLNQKLSLFLLASVNLDLHNGRREDEKGLLGSGNIIHPAVAVGLGYEL